MKINRNFLILAIVVLVGVLVLRKNSNEGFEVLANPTATAMGWCGISPDGRPNTVLTAGNTATGAMDLSRYNCTPPNGIGDQAGLNSIKCPFPGYTKKFDSVTSWSKGPNGTAKAKQVTIQVPYCVCTDGSKCPLPK